MMDKKQAQASDARAQAAEDATPAPIDPEASETVEGGKYLAADGKTLVDANGEPLNEKKS
jgi:hypothetical protein